MENRHGVEFTYSEKDKKTRDISLDLNTVHPFRIDQEQFQKFSKWAMVRFAELYDIVSREAARTLAMPTFNHNSYRHVGQLLDFYGLDLPPLKPSEPEKKSTSIELWLPIVEEAPGRYPILEQLAELKKFEALKRRLSLFDENPGDLFAEDHPSEFRRPMILDGSRVHHQDVSALPYEMRFFLKPSSPSQRFYYFDLSLAELTFMACLSHDKALLFDILNGYFKDHWANWFGVFSSPDFTDRLKKSIYGFCYSLNSVNFWPVKGSTRGAEEFYTAFFKRYPDLYAHRIGVKNSIQNHDYIFPILDNGSELNVSRHQKQLHAALNYPNQCGLSLLMSRLVENLYKEVAIYTFNYDSLLFGAPRSLNIELFESKIQKVFQESGFTFRFTITTGENYGEAGGFKPRLYQAWRKST